MVNISSQLPSVSGSFYYVTGAHYALLAQLIALHKICVTIISTSFGVIPEIALSNCDVEN